ncbi:MAG: SMP-30/gluconolactonase/LRE family protein [Microcella sp.]|uniref:SMP-30/gluconolactonase/LRE family protein n=1 Tax=Microcella sp. TaxID=1913979 RepID=UPI0024CDE6BD|nr:SMP-30/gluconolactonase/LRE family protein [Microcella sp.]UYN83157.1 MAG: SMP-30/gluconolactonase/LRE family protein [Microcella sp.]
MVSAIAVSDTLERLATGCEWAEGPVWLPAPGRVRFSDVPGNRVLEWHAATGETTVYSHDSGFANGRTLDREGRVVQCSHGRRQVERDDAGTITSLCAEWQGRRFNSPNDVVVTSDGAVWFTDPPYGIHESGREGHPAEPEYGGCFVFRFDPSSGEVAAVITDMVHPNGLAFSPDETTLYVADTGYLQIEGAPRAIRAYRVRDGEVAEGREVVAVTPGATDGLRVDVDGRIWSSSADSVQVFSHDGALLERIAVPETVSNVCFGGPDGTDLFITATTSLYRLRTTTRDAAAVRSR